MSIFKERCFEVAVSMSKHPCLKEEGVVFVDHDDFMNRSIGWQCSMCEETWSLRVRVDGEVSRRGLDAMSRVMAYVLVVEDECEELFISGEKTCQKRCK